MGPNEAITVGPVQVDKRSSTEGFSRIPVSYIVGDSALSEEEVLSALEELQRSGYICYHQETETLLDLLSLKWNPLRNGVDKETGEVKVNNRLPGALRQLESLVDSPANPCLCPIGFTSLARFRPRYL